MKLLVLIYFALAVVFFASSSKNSQAEAFQAPTAANSKDKNSSCLNDVYACFEEHELLFSTMDESENFSWPSNDSAILELCTELQSTVFCLRNEVLKDCSAEADASERELAGQLISAVELYHDAICPSPASRSAFLRQTASCYLEPAVSSKVLRQLRIFSLLMALGGGGDARCCSALHFKDAVGRINGQYCQSEVAAYVNRLLDDVLGPSIKGCDVKAGDRASSSAVCQARLPEELRRQFALITAEEEGQASTQQSRQAAGLGSAPANFFGPGFSLRDGRENGGGDNGNDDGGWSVGEIFHLAKVVSVLQTQHPFIFHLLKAVWQYCIDNDCMQ